MSRIAVVMLAGLTLVTCAHVGRVGPAPGQGVSVLYLVPSDQLERPGMTARLERALLTVQAWTAGQGDGGTFLVAQPAVTVVKTGHPSAWYGDEGKDVFQRRVVGDGFEAVEGSYSQSRMVWVMYIDADPPCGSVYGGATVPGGARRGAAGQRPARPRG